MNRPSSKSVRRASLAGSEPTERVAIATGPSGRAVSDLNEAVTEVETEAIEEVIAVAEKIEATGIVLSASGVAKIEVVAAEPRNEAHEVVTTEGDAVAIAIGMNGIVGSAVIAIVVSRTGVTGSAENVTSETAAPTEDVMTEVGAIETVVTAGPIVVVTVTSVAEAIATGEVEMTEVARIGVDAIEAATRIGTETSIATTTSGVSRSRADGRMAA